ncbi:TPA: MFS transporter [Klebsiella pneumoniae]|nr:MFS transporter [Klebsiella pneumoniae]
MHKAKIISGVVSMSTLALSGLVVTSAFSAIMRDFPDVPPSTIQMLASLPNLGALVVTLLVGWLAMRISKKHLALLGIACISVGGLVPAFWHSDINVLLACSILQGIGVGFITTVSPMLIAMLFAEGEERAALMGFNTACTALGAMVLMMVGGLLGADHWYHTYYVFLMAVVVFLVVLFALPSAGKVNRSAQPSHTGQKATFRKVVGDLDGYIYLISALTFALSFLYLAYLSNISVIISNKGLGGTALTGIINAVGTFGGMMTGFLMKYVRRIVGQHALGYGFLALALAFVCTLYGNNLSIVIIGSLFSGIAMCLVMANAPYEISILARPEQIAPAMSIYIFANSLGAIVSPVVFKLSGIAIGQEAYFFSGSAALAIALLLLLSQFGRRITNRSRFSNSHSRTI